MKALRKIVCLCAVFIGIAINSFADVIDIPRYRRSFEFSEIFEDFSGTAIFIAAAIIIVLCIVYFIASKFEKNKDNTKENNIEVEKKEESDEKDQ